jgi:hypothetical protein
VAGVEEILAPGQFAGAARALGALAGAREALALAADGVQRGVGTADQMEVISDDPCLRQRRLDRLAVSLMPRGT